MSFSSTQHQSLPCALWSAARLCPSVKGFHGCNGGSCLCCLLQDSANSPSQACLLRGVGSPVLLPVVPLPSVPPVFQSHTLPPTSAMLAKSQLTSCMRTSHSSCLFPWFPASMQRQLWHILLIPSLILPLSFQISSQPHFFCLCRLWNPHAETGGDTSFRPLKPSSCLGLPGAGALQEMSLAEDMSSLPEGMRLCPWQGSSCCPNREKWKSNLMKNLISVLLGSNEIFYLICFSFQNLTLLRTLPHFCHILSTCVFMDFTLPTLVSFFRKKNQPSPNPCFSYSAISDHQN